jgi:septum site-determining protein MinD
VDCPAGIELGFRNAISAANEAIIVTTPEVTAVRDADRVIGLLEANDIRAIRLIVNRIRPSMVEMQDMMSVEDVLEILAVPLLGIIPDDERIITASNRGEPIALSQERSLPAIAFSNIARRLDGEEVPFLDLMAAHNNLFNRIRRFFRGSS